MRGHKKMILDMAWDHDKTYLFTSSVDATARSWMPEVGDAVREFEGATRSTTLVKCQGDIRKGLAPALMTVSSVWHAFSLSLEKAYSSRAV